MAKALQLKPAAAVAMAAVLLKKKPKADGEKVDLLYTVRSLRYTIQHLAQALENREKELKQELITASLKMKGRGVAGKEARVTLEPKPFAMITDFAALVRFAAKKGNEDLLQKRVSMEAVNARWDAKKVVPGVKREEQMGLSVEKIA